MTYCLDTNIVIDFLRGKKDIIEKIAEINTLYQIFISPITLCELYKGAYLSKETEKNLIDIENFLLSVELLDFTKEACKKFGEEYSKLESKGKMTEEIDLMIAAIAKVRNLIIVTRNKRHFENIDIKIEVW